MLTTLPSLDPRSPLPQCEICGLEHPENQCVRNVPYIAGMFLPRSADICRYLPVRVASPGRKVYETVCFLAQRCRSSVVEHPLGKGEVESSIPSGSTISATKVSLELQSFLD